MLSVLPLVKPTPHPEGLRPPRVTGFGQPHGPLGRDRCWRAHPPLGQPSQDLQTTLVTLPMGRRETQADFAPILTNPPHAAHPGFLAPPPSRLLHGRNQAGGHGLRAQSPRAPRLVLLTQPLAALTAPTCRAHALPQDPLSTVLDVPLRPPPHGPLHNEPVEHVAGRRHLAPQRGPIGVFSATNLGQLHPPPPFGRLQRPLLIPIAVPRLLATGFIPAAPSGLGLCLCQRFLQHPLRRQAPSRASYFLATLGIRLPLQ